jgi:2-deoxy-D-gluconate 3-dehydrogenase
VKALTEREKHLDILINNAGVSWGAPLDEFPEVGWDKVFDTNVKGVFFLTQKLLPLLEARATNDDPSRVVNIGSIDGIRTPIFDTHSYGPSKAALHSLTRQMGSKLVKRNIIMNAIAPGPFPTWMLSTGVGTGGDVDNTDWGVVARGNPRKRVGTPEDIAGLAIFLCSRAGAYTVGEVISCDGGQVVS